jgi:mRNA-degrading endonuclease RelE of RelBE toxin-antitoxin system
VIYEVHDDLLLVVVLKVDHRSDVYRRMRRGRGR